MKCHSPNIDQLLLENVRLKRDLEETRHQIKAIEDANLTAFAIGDAIQDGICEVNPEGIVIAVNKSFLDITEFKKEKIIGQHIETLKAKKYFTRALSMDIIKTKQKSRAMTTINGNNKRVLLVGTPILDRNGQLLKVITIMRDLTDLINLREKLEKEREKNKEIENQLSTMLQEEWQYFIGTSPSALKIKELIKYVAPTDATVLIVGETGSGKEVIAKEIFEKSDRRDGPYVKINCSAIPENLLESELFGHVKGAFTGAEKKDKKGLFEVANGGTMLLDEITEMPIALQPKLLRVLQEREVTPVGGVSSVKIDVRVIASCNKQPEELIRQGKFRADLYYRLNVFPIDMPSLRERREDIADIALLFLEKFNHKYKKDKILGSTAIHALAQHHWPGNVRELENSIERMVILSEHKILNKEDVIKAINDFSSRDYEDDLEHESMSLKAAVKALEKKMIEKALREGGSTYSAAKLLQTTQPTVVRKAQSLDIDVRAYTHGNKNYE